MNTRIALLLCLVCSALAIDAQKSRVLVVADSLSLKNTHSIFLKSLTERGYNLTFKTTESTIHLQKYGEFLYDHLVLFASDTEESLEAKDVIEFIDAGHDVLIAVNNAASEGLRDIVSDCGVEFEEDGTSVIDHSNVHHDDYHGRHNLIIADNLLNVPVITGSKKTAPVLFRGLGQKVRESPLNYQLLTASSSAYSGRIDGKSSKQPRLLGKRNVLVSSLQARNNARVTISGSLDLFSDKLFKSKVDKYSGEGKKSEAGPSGNQAFAEEISKWTFKERGVIRARDVTHSKEDGTNPAMYTIKDNIKYSVVIEEFVGGKWIPYLTDDVQVEFRMIDPYIRRTLAHDSAGKYSTAFAVPDVNGVYTFKIEYHRQGYSSIHSVARVPVRPFRHDQYERFIPSAFPYYAGAFSMLIGLFVFSIVFLYHTDVTKSKTH